MPCTALDSMFLSVKFLPGLPQEYMERVLSPFVPFSRASKVVLVENTVRGTEHLILK